jgi:PAS domain S-box-containing protein
MSINQLSQVTGPGGPALPSPANSPRRILLVDDRSDTRQRSLEVLAGAGYEVEAVKDGAAGWDALQAKSYDLLITDNNMPTMTGLEMIEKLRSARMGVPVILATAQAPTREFDRKPWLKPDATLQQPFSNEDLLEAVSRVLSRDARMGPALRASEVSYRRLFEAAKDGILILDADTGRISDVNPFLIELLGFSHSEMVGKTVGEISPFKDLVSNQAMLERLQKHGYVRYEDLPLEARDGRRVDVEFVSNVYQAGDRKVIQCNIRDITARKKAELVSSRLAAIVESSDDAIIGTDMNSIITSWNRGAEKLFGYTAGEMVGTSIMRLIPPDRQHEERRIVNQIKQGEKVEHFDTLRQTKDGRLIHVSVTLSPIKDATGKIIGLSKVARDISDRQAAENQIRQLNAELEQRVAERTAQLLAANLELEAFSYSVSHDLRAPLRHILGFVELLQQEAVPPLSRNSLEHLQTISQATKQMGDIIDDLLAFSRIGHAEMQKEPVALDPLVREVLGDFQAETRHRNIAWEVRPLPTVRADRALLRLALVNLISNAIKFTSTRAQARIEIGCAPRRGGQTVIFIRDNGVGFDPRYAGKLFGVFQRLHNRDEFEGTGIGLANVQRIIHRHGGRTWAEGAVDGGATFFFSLPK